MKYKIPHQTTLFEALKLFIPQTSNNNLKDWIKLGRVTIDDLTVSDPRLIVFKDQMLELGAKKKFIKSEVSVIYEDSHLVAINKPIGLLSVATAFDKEETLFTFLKSHYYPKKVYVVHRLDQDTSGIMLFALSEKSFSKLKSIFAAHQIEREYKAIVEGKLSPSSGTWRSFLQEDKNYFVHSSSNPNQGEEAITHYEVDKISNKYSWLTLKLETGKKNQIRVHCSSAGHPVVGDKKYGAKTSPIKRLCLHAHTLNFDHPITGKRLKLSCPPPPEFDKL